MLVLDATKMTRTAAALVLGCQKLDPRISIQGVVLNNVNGEGMSTFCVRRSNQPVRIPVVGALPGLAANPLPERHLGLVPPQEHDEMERVEQELLAWMEGRLDLDALLSVARGAPVLEPPAEPRTASPDAQGLKSGTCGTPLSASITRRIWRSLSAPEQS